MKRFVKYAVIAVNLVSALAVVTYVHFWVTTVTVINGSRQHLSGVRIQFDETQVWSGNLAPNESKWTFGVFRNVDLSSSR